MLRIGQIEYANCTPLYHLLREQYSCTEYEFVSGVPAKLNALLSSGAIDVCPSSSIEYALHSEQYRVLPEISISSDGAVASVLLFSRIPIEELNGKTIQLSSESATSVNLLKILMKQLYHCSCEYKVNHSPIADALIASPALLLIGDGALRASMIESDARVYDLGEIWRNWTGLPFVFALWLCRRAVAQDPVLLELSRRLIQAKMLTPLHFERIVQQSSDLSWMKPESLLSYWRSNISYQLEERHVSGLMSFYEKCYEMKLVKSVPVLNFTSQ
jgi:chorismate dehydratase